MLKVHHTQAKHFFSKHVLKYNVTQSICHSYSFLLQVFFNFSDTGIYNGLDFTFGHSFEAVSDSEVVGDICREYDVAYRVK